MRAEAGDSNESPGREAATNRASGATAASGAAATRTNTAAGGTAFNVAATVVTFGSRDILRRARATPVEAMNVTWKLDEPPLSANSDVIALVRWRPTMFMAALSQLGLSMGPVSPLTVAVAPVMVVVPKFASGNTP